MLEGFTGSYHRILPISSLRKVREQGVHDSTNQSLFPENEGNFGGNQLPDGSIRLSPLRPRRRMICPSISKRAFARDSPDFAFFRHFSRFFRALLSLKPLSRSRSVAGVHVVCACVVVYCVCCVLCCAIFVVKI